MHDWLVSLLHERGRRAVVVTGSREQRLAQALTLVEPLRRFGLLGPVAG
jgi:hypothetical protein